ncbi:glycosyltransferase [Halobacillus halophilus]|uniref:glycosyltransferase n=1 Tax=Halobacillus halophilus TaxID=1570 RepID=UPI001CD689D9|nr:glycosyltransferase [Halobacillus halophilus]MCA1012041.1 glycosyltransferase [Halobacillus halophilus]
MRISILTTGTRGDTQPFIALGKELKSLGHEVKLAGFENYQQLVERHELNFHPIKGDISEISKEMAKSSIKSDNPIQFFTSFRKMKPYIKDKQMGMQEDLYEACVDAEAIIYHPGAAIGQFVGELKGIPTILASPFPMGPTEEYPALIFYQMQFGKKFNLFTHKLFEKGFWMTVKPSVRQYWKRQFDTLPESFQNPFSKEQTKDHLALASVSRHVFQEPKKNIRWFGYWFLDEDLSSWNPPEDLQNFLSEGPPPVYVGFGSIYDDQALETTELVIDALRKAGQRGILATGWNSTEDIEETENMYFIESVPHSWLFPKLSGVVHHGGAGTTAAAFRAGIPSFVIPHGNDQYAWGKRTEELGVGPSPVPRKKLTVENLAEGIREMQGEGIKSNAYTLGKNIQLENGAGDAARYIDSFLQR